MTAAKRRSVKIGARDVGDDHPTFIVFEAGPTHDGLDTAKALATHAAKAGAHAIKFQIVDPDRLVANRKQMFSYEVLVDRQTGATETVEEPLYDILVRRALSKAQWREVKNHCDGLGLAFFATIAFEDEIDLLLDLGCHSIKIASGDVNHHPLIRLAARTGTCIQLDTGNASLGEIEQAVDVIRSEGNENIISTSARPDIPRTSTASICGSFRRCGRCFLILLHSRTIRLGLDGYRGNRNGCQFGGEDDHARSDHSQHRAHHVARAAGDGGVCDDYRRSQSVQWGIPVVYFTTLN